MFFRITFFIIILSAFYYLGISHCQQENISNKIEEIKHVKNKEIKILLHPNANRNELLKLLYNNKL